MYKPLCFYSGIEEITPGGLKNLLVGLKEKYLTLISVWLTTEVKVVLLKSILRALTLNAVRHTTYEHTK